MIMIYDFLIFKFPPVW